MKKVLLILNLLIGFSVLQAQNVSSISSAKEIIWYGLDFSKAKFIGNVGSKAQVIKDKHMSSWNRLVANEPQNFTLKEELDKEIYYDLGPVDKANAATDVSKMETFNKVNTDFDNNTLSEMVKNYSAGEKKEGVGLVFIIASLDKPEENSSAYAVFFDVATREIIASKKFTGEVQGVGFRNYWAGAWKSIIKKMGKNYSTWK